MIGDIARTIGQLDDRRFLRVIGKSVLISLVFFAALWIAVGFLLGRIELVEIAWVDRALDVIGGLLIVVVTIFLFPGVAVMTVGFFLEDVCAAVEARHYPNLPPPRRQSIGEVLITGIRLGATVLLVNLVLLPLYLVLIFLPPLNLVLYYLVNGALLGREFFELVAFRRLPPAEARAIRHRYRGRVWLVGAAIAFLFTVPLAGLLVPGLGAALMLHVYQRSSPNR